MRVNRIRFKLIFHPRLPGSSEGICVAFKGCFLISPLLKSEDSSLATISDCLSRILSRSLSISLRNFFTFLVSLLSWNRDALRSVSASEQGDEYPDDTWLLMPLEICCGDSLVSRNQPLLFFRSSWWMPGNRSVKKDAVFTGIFNLFRAKNSASFIILLTRFSSAKGILYWNIKSILYIILL